MLHAGPKTQERTISARRPPSRLAALRANPLPEGTITVGTGLVIAGIASYLFLAISARALGPDAFAPLSVMWVITFLAGPGFFLPVEQEVTRALAHRRAEGIGGGPVIVRAAQLGGILAAILVVITLIVSPWMVSHLFDGYWLLLVGFLLGLVGYYAGHLGRGTFSGMGRFGAYGLYMGGEGVIRMALCVALAAVGVKTVGLYGLAVGIPPLIAVSIAVRRERNLIEPGPEAPFSEVSSNLGWLLGGSVLAAFLINAGPIAVTLLATPSEKSLAGKPDAPMVGNAYERKLPAKRQLPRTLTEAAALLARSKPAQELFGTAFVEHFAASREWEEREFRRVVTDWELARYFEII